MLRLAQTAPPPPPGGLTRLDSARTHSSNAGLKSLKRTLSFRPLLGRCGPPFEPSTEMAAMRPSHSAGGWPAHGGATHSMLEEPHVKTLCSELEAFLEARG